MSKHNFRNLKIYQRSVAFAVDIYKITRLFPKEELYGLTSQIRRAVTSIALNIAEGSGNSSEKEFKRFLEIALRSDYEVITCLEIALLIGYCNQTDHARLLGEADEIAAMIIGFARNL
jgi:four helix bundle protein